MTRVSLATLALIAGLAVPAAACDGYGAAQQQVLLAPVDDYGSCGDVQPIDPGAVFAVPQYRQRAIVQAVPSYNHRVFARQLRAPAFAPAYGGGGLQQQQILAVPAYGGVQAAPVLAAPRRGLFGLRGGRSKTIQRSFQKQVVR